MKRIFGWVIGVLVLLTAAPVWSQNPSSNMYISGNIGFGIRPDADISISTLPFENDPAFVINGAIGTRLNPKFRVEGEIGYHVNTADQGGTGVDWTFGAISFMGNGYFDIPTNSPLTPYLGAGLGFALVGLEGENFGVSASDSDLVAAFQLMAGLAYDISPKAALTFGYRYFSTTDPSYILPGIGAFKTEYASHEFLFGARFRF
jgi:opacity protein-like surface antigen